MSDLIQSFMTGADAGRQIRQGQQQRQIGGLMASGDYGAAAKAAYGNGDLQTGSQIDQRQAQQAAAQRQQAEEQRRVAIGGQVAAGDLQGARSAAYGAGDMDMGAQIDGWLKSASETEKAAARERTANLAKVGYALRDMPYEQRKAWLSQNGVSLQEQMGIPAEALSGFDPSDANIDVQISQAQSLSDMIAADRRERQDNLAAERLAEQARHNQASEGLAGQRERRVAAGRPSGGGGGLGGPPSQGSPPRISDPSAYAALPSGTVFTAPDGTTRRKP